MADPAPEPVTFGTNIVTGSTEVLPIVIAEENEEDDTVVRREDLSELSEL